MSVALITGTSTGIGRSTAIQLARNGYYVFASMRNPEAADPEMVSSGQVEVIPLDVSDNSSMESAVAGVLDSAGRIDILVNNAGIGIGSSIEETSEKDLRDTMETNFFGAWRMMQLVLPGMRAQGGGHIVNLTSVAGRFVMAFHGPPMRRRSMRWRRQAKPSRKRPFGITCGFPSLSPVRSGRPFLTRRRRESARRTHPMCSLSTGSWRFSRNVSRTRLRRNWWPRRFGMPSRPISRSCVIW